MAGFWHRFFNKKSAKIPVLAEFAAYADKAIALIIASHGQLEDEQLLALFEANDIPAKEAVELLLFLPIAFCRHLLTEINWPDYYFEYVSAGKYLKRFYSDNRRYTSIQAALHRYLAGEFSKENYHKIAGRSASFHSLNALLLANPGRKLAEVIAGPELITYANNVSDAEIRSKYERLYEPILRSKQQ